MKIDDVDGCGISWLWMLPQDHKFTPACKSHDLDYELHKNGALKDGNSRRVDKSFLNRMLELSDGAKDKALAWLFWGIARGWGLWRWRQIKNRTGGKTGI